MVNKEFGRYLQGIRESKRPVRSRRVISELTGLSHDALGKYERGERKPRKKELFLIADYYNIPVDDLKKEMNNRKNRAP